MINRNAQSPVQLRVSQAGETFLSSSAEEDRIAHPTWLSPAPTAEVLPIPPRPLAPLSNRLRSPALRAQSNPLLATPHAWRGNRRVFPVSQLPQPTQPCSHSNHARARRNFKFAISQDVIVRKAGDTPAATVQNKSAPPWRGALN